MNTKKISSEELMQLRLSAIAKKHGCSTDYVRKVLKEEREQKSVLSLKILKDANDMLEVLKRETTVTV